MQRTRKHLSFANVVSMVALFVALGGVSYAAISLPNNSVGTKQIKKNAVTGKKIKANAIGGGKIKDGSLLAKEFKAGQIPVGPKGATGATGPQGPAGVVGAITVQRDDAALADNATVGLQVTCPAGTKIIGGGSSLQASSSDDIHQTVSRPFRTTPGAEGDLPADGESFDAWRVVYRNPTSGVPNPTTMRAFAICAEVPALTPVP